MKNISLIYLRLKWKFFCSIFTFTLFIIFSSCHPPSDQKIPGMVFIPAGQFIIGSNEEDQSSLAKETGIIDGTFYVNEKPERKIHLKSFYIDKYEVTNEQYYKFVYSTGYKPPPDWDRGKFNTARKKHPVIYVNWYDADIYCQWAGKRLPTEEEWEKAFRGPHGNIYPWGNTFDENRGNFLKGDTVPVGSMPEDRSFYDIFDLGGNVIEWTGSWYMPYPGSTHQSNDYGEKYRVLRGATGNGTGHYKLTNIFARGSYRHFYIATGKTYDIGFRCAKEG